MSINETELTELITKRFAEGTAESGDIVAFAALRMLALLKKIGDSLAAINGAIADDDIRTPTLSARLDSIDQTLQKLVKGSK